MWKNGSIQAPKLDRKVALELVADEFSVRGMVVTLRGKANLAVVRNPATLAADLRDLSRRHGLPESSIHIGRLDAWKEGESGKVSWFSQFLIPSKYEEVFHWPQSGEVDENPTSAARWSQLVSLWKEEGAELIAMELETSIRGGSPCCWFLVVSVKEGQAETVYLGPCS
jgi:hypothetical protein